MLKKLPVYVSIIAALIVIIMGLIMGESSFEILQSVCLFIALFFVLSSILQFYLNKQVFYEDKNIDNSVSNEEELGNSIDFGFGLSDNSVNDRLDEDGLK